MATAQIALRLHHVDAFAGQKGFIYGTSTGNIVSFTVHKAWSSVPLHVCIIPKQRIEGWWSQLQRFKTDWWIDICKVKVVI